MNKLQRKASMCLRKRKDQTKTEVLCDNQSEPYILDNHDGWSYVSFHTPSKASHSRSSASASMCINQVKYNPLTHGPSSLNFHPFVTDTEGCLRTRGKEGRRSEESAEKRLWRKSVIGIGKEERNSGIVYKNFGFVDHPRQKRATSEINIPYKEPDRVQNGKPEVQWGNTYRQMEYQPASLPETIHDVERQKEKISLLKGMLWHKTDRLFSRWKERFFILTSNHLQCYKQCPISTDDLILFIFKFELSSISSMDLTEKKGYLTITLSVHKMGKILLRSTGGIQEWFHVIKRGCTLMNSTQLRQNREAEDIKPWLLARPGLGTTPVHYSSSSMINSYHQAEQDMYQTREDVDNRYRTYTKQRKKKTNRHPRRARSFIEPSRTYNPDIQKNHQIHRSEDSGNSSLSASVGRSRRKDNYTDLYEQNY